MTAPIRYKRKDRSTPPAPASTPGPVNPTDSDVVPTTGSTPATDKDKKEA